jgi:hypothetical protein
MKMWASTLLVLMEDRPYGQIALQVLERLFDGNKLGIVLPQQCGAVLGEVGAQQIASFPPSYLPQLLAVEGVAESGACLVHRARRRSHIKPQERRAGPGIYRDTTFSQFY